MANNEEITLHVSENSPYVIGARAYVEQTENGAVITIIDKEGTTTATVSNGKGIASATLNEDYTLTLIYTDGTSVTTTSIRGEKGESGVYCGSEEPDNPDVDVWIDPTGDPYPMEDEIANAVDEWITAHPEYVTTVQDGAITVPKFAAGVVDTGLNKAGYPADSKATGDAFTADRTRLTAVEGEADALDARITNLAQLTDGSTTGDAELMDARVVGSTTYSTLHEAIDTEFTNVKSALNAKFDGTRNILNAYTSVIGMINSSGNVAGSTGRTSDFLPCEAETEYYASYNYGITNAFPYVVGFYGSDKSFISRLVNSDNAVSFTTPSNCAFIRISLKNASSSFSEDKQITKGGVYPYRYPVEAVAETKDSETVEKLRLYTLGITDADIQPYIINSSNKWVYYVSGEYGFHVCIPISEGDSISIIANNKASVVWAMLTSDRWKNAQESPDFVATYNLEVDDDGNLDWEPIVDGGGNPVLDTRHIVNARESTSFVAVPDSHFLYLAASLGNTNNLPQSLIINGHQYIINETASAIDEPSYETILFDDFDTFDSSIWKRLTNEPQLQGLYNSRFITTPDNARCEQSMLVLKCSKPDEAIDLGTYIDHDGNEQNCEYVAPYISSEDSYVIPSGKISARIKLNQNMGKHFPWCFWTFGQGSSWGYAHEMDIVEQTASIQSTEVTSQNGTVVTAGSIKNILGNHTHAKDSLGSDIKKDYYFNITANLKSGSSYSAETELSNKLLNIDVTEWHEYAVVWDADSISYFVDGEMTNSIKASAIGAVDESGTTGFTHPQDLRFNIKALEWSDGNEAEMFVDWVKIERLAKTPTLSIAHADVALAVDGSVYINPTFNTDCSNKAFTVEVDGNSVNYDKYLNDESKMVVHKLTGVSVGASTITITSANGVTMGTFTVTVS